jgi:hypothetical protein
MSSSISFANKGLTASNTARIAYITKGSSNSIIANIKLKDNRDFGLRGALIGFRNVNLIDNYINLLLSQNNGSARALFGSKSITNSILDLA